MKNLRVVLYAAYLLLPIVLSFPYMKSDAPRSPLLLELLFSLLVSIFLVNASGKARTLTRRVTGIFVPALILFIFHMLELISYYLQGYSFNDAFYFHVSLSTLITGARSYSWLVLLFMGTSLIVMLADLFLSRIEHASWGRHPFTQGFAGVCLALVLLPNPPKNFFAGYLEYRAVQGSPQDTMQAIRSELQKNHVNLDAFSQYEITVRPPLKSKNLVLLYLESIESSYLDESRFPGLLPNIKNAMQHSLHFADLRQYKGTGWTISGIVASQCGVPLLAGGNDSIYQSEIVKHINCLGDILKKAGYYQVYMGGASISFAGKGSFYNSHGYDEILGRDELIGTLTDPDYLNGWGLYDDTLFSLAADKFRDLSRRAVPFNLTLLTLDTHHPDGDASKTCPRYAMVDNRMLHAVHCTDFLFGRFIAAIKKFPGYSDTVVFVMADHLAMRNVAEHLYPPERTFFAFALNASNTGEIRQAGSHFDIPHTVIDLLNIETDAQFAFGQSLLQQGDTDRFSLFNNHKEGILSAYLTEIQKKAGINICEGNGIHIKSRSMNTIDIGGQSLVMSAEGIPGLPVK